MRARQIQNDVVVLIYQEGNTTYNPETMPTNVAHVFAIVRPFTDPVTGETKYRYVPHTYELCAHCCYHQTWRSVKEERQLLPA